MKMGINIFKATIQIAFLLSGLRMTAQNVNYELTPTIPPSPQAVAFNRLGDYQVNNNYGAPDINIPLFEIDFHGYKIPLTLHYEASPLKPGYNYDVTGVGWTLSGNSCVSRTIKDRADEVGRFNNPFDLDPFNNSSYQPKLYLDNVSDINKMNFQYDIFNIVLPSGRTIPFFMYMWEGGMHYELMSLDSHVKIVCSYSSNSIDAFMVTDENGVKYHFTLSEKAANVFLDDPNANRNVTWLLTSIDIPSRGTIYYQYDEPVTINVHNIIREPVITVSRLYDCWGDCPNGQDFKVSGTFQSQSPRYDMRFIKRIIYGPTTVEFNYKNDRKHMKEIVVSENGDTIRKYTLNVNGYDSDWHLNSLVISGQDNEDRLEYGFTYYNNNAGEYTDYWGNRCDGGPSVNGANGHTINNYGLDNLGNFNLFFGYDGIGWSWTDTQYQLSHDGILAQLIAKKEDDPDYYWKMKLQSTTDGDTRIPTPPNRHGILNSITYPNGGSTSFYWEKHRFPTATAADGDFVLDRRRQRIIEGGGFRIESIINWTADGTIASKDYYRYGFTLGDIIHRNFPLPLPDSLNLNDTINHHIGCGEAVVDPNLFTFMNGFSYSRSLEPDLHSSTAPGNFRKMLIGQDSPFKSIANRQYAQNVPMWWEATFSASRFRSLIGGRQPVVYPEITVYHGHPYEQDECTSKTVYKYDIYNILDPSMYYMSSLGQTTIPDTAYFEFLYFESAYPALSCMEFPSKRHQLKSKTDYSFNTNNGKWEPVSEESYSYSEDYCSESSSVFESCISRENYLPNYDNLSPNQIGYEHPLSGVPLRNFYKDNTQKFGRFTMTGKNTTTLRPGGTRSKDNTQTEVYSYLYSGVLKNKDYSDLPYGIGVWYTGECDKNTEYSYIGEEDDNPDTVITAMKSKNMLASMVTTETFTKVPESSMLMGRKVGYAFFGDDILPSLISESHGGQYEESVEIISYDSFGNPTEIQDKKTGIYSAFLWDIYGRYLLAMIKDARFSQIQNIAQLRAVSSQARYSMLQSSLPNVQIQTWDYKPLVGVSEHTDVNGQTIRYEYDGLGRLKKEMRVVNGTAEPEILRKYEYNYMNGQL